MSAKIEEPVVVNPEMDSKNALVKLGIAPVNKYGNVPKKPRINQPMLTIIILSFLPGSVFLNLRVKMFSSNPGTKMVIDEKSNGKVVASL